MEQKRCLWCAMKENNAYMECAVSVKVFPAMEVYA